MTGPRRDTLRALYVRLLRLYPHDFRERFEDDLLQAFDDRRAEPRFSGLWGGVRLVGLLLRDFVTSVPIVRDPNIERMGVAEMWYDFWRDLRFGARMLIKDPVFTIAAVTTLALGIGLNAATYSAVQGVLLRPLQGVETPEELVQIYRTYPGIQYGSSSIPHYQDVRDRSTGVFDNVALWAFQPLSLSADGRTERTIGMIVSANFLQTYGVRPALGRAFIPGVEDRQPGAHPVAIISDGFWETRFGADPDIVGRTITLNGRPFEIVGVTPADFRGPVNYAVPPIYVPLMMQGVLDRANNRIERRGNNWANVIGRLRDGATIDQARTVFDGVLSQLKEEYPSDYDNDITTTLVPQNEAGLHPSFGSAQVGMSAVMMAVVGLLLLIACVNVANLFLARARDRRREMGIRLSIGAGSGRVVRQLLTESLLFSVVAGAAGLFLARIAIGFLDTFRLPIDGPWDMTVAIDSSVLWFTAAVSLATGFLFGMAPALQAAQPETVAAVKGAASARVGRSRVSSVLVVVQVALSLLLLMSSGLFLRSLQGATEIDPGFDEPSNLVMMSVDPGLQGYDTPRAEQLWDRVLDEVRALPDVASAGLTRVLPLGLGTTDTSVEIPGYEFAEGEARYVYYSFVSEGYLETMGIDLLEGRTFNRSDDATAPPVVIVNERFAERFWPGESAVGKTVITSGEREVIGVVETGKYRSLGEDPAAFMYFPNRASFRPALTLVARTAGNPAGALQRMQEIVRTVDPDLPVYDVRTMEDHMGIALMPARLGGTVLGLFGLLGLMLAAVGIYGVMAYSVSQRRQELGIRVAMGADRASVLRLVLAQGFKLATLGTVLGIAGAIGAAQLVKGLLYNTSPFDPVAFGAVPLLLLAVAGLAVYLPARRAASVDPIRALSCD